MQERIRSLLKAPTFADEVQAARAEILNRVLLLLALVLAILVLPVLLTAQYPVNAIVFLLLAIGFLGIVWRLSKREYTGAASALLVIGLYLINMTATVIWGGIGAPMTGGHIFLLLITGMLLGVRASVLATCISVVWMILLGFFQLTQGTEYRRIDVGVEGQIIIQVFYIAVIGGLIVVASEMLTRSFRRLQQGDQKLRATLDQLQNTTFSKDYVDNILRSMSNILIVLDSEGVIRTANPAALRTLGYSQAELIGKPFREISLQDGTDTNIEDSTRNGDALLITKSQAYLQVNMFQSVMRDSHGRMTGMIYQMEDMSERRRVEAEKMRSAMRYRALFEQTNDAIFLLNLQGAHLAVNQRATQMLGYSTEELTRLSYRDIVVEREHDRSDNILARLLNNERIQPFYERAFRRKDGTEITVEINVELVRDADGNPLHIQSIVRDITERKQIERQLSYQAKLLQSVSDAIVSMDMDTVILSWNRAAEQVYGWKEKEALGQRFDQLVPTMFEHESENFIREKYLQRGYWRSEVTQRHRDGKQLSMLSSVSLLRDADHQMIGTVSINHDITARKEAETELEQRLVQLAALRQVDVEITSTLQIDQVLHVALSSSFVLSSADAGYILLCENDRYYLKDVIGAYENEPLEINSEWHPRGAIHRAIQARTPLLIPNVQENGDNVATLPDTLSQIVIPLTAHDQLIGVLNLEAIQEESFTPEVYDFVKLLMARVAVALDNARLYELSQHQLRELTESSKRVSQLEQLKTDMIRIASHDLRNPIGVIKGYLEVVETDILPKLNDDEREYIDAIRRNITRIQTIITDILSLERIEHAVRTGKGEFVDLGDMVRRVIYEIEPHAELKQLGLENRVSSEQIFVQADSAQLHEAIFNLIENAVKYTYEHGRVEIKLYRMDGQARFSVTDTGIGIPAEYQGRLFEPFFRAKTPESVDIEGTGLGLHLVKNIIERYQGTMFFSSAYHQGSTFGFTMPLVDGT